MRKLGVLLLSIWLIVSGLFPLINLNLPSADLILGVLAAAAGILLLLSFSRVKLGGKWAVILLAFYLLLSGLIPLLKIEIPASGLILGILAAAAGVLLLLER